jgi:MFS family permease
LHHLRYSLKLRGRFWAAGYGLGFVANILNDPAAAATRAALVGTGGMFFSHGVMVAVRAAYIPVIKDQLNADDATLAMCLTAMGLGSLLAIALGNLTIKRIGSSAATLASIVAAALLFAVQAFITDAWIMAASLFFLGTFVGMSDIAMNVQASVVEQRAAASLMTRIHACWSVGAIAGSILAGLLIERMPSAAFTIGFSLLSVFGAYACVRPFIAETQNAGPANPLLELPPLALLPVSLIAFLALLAVTGVKDWVPLYLIGNLGSSLGLSVQTFAAFQVTTAIGRFFGDAIRDRVGDTPLLIAGGLLGGIALAGGIASQSAAGMFICLAIMGLAHANVIPAVISIAGKRDPGNESRNVSAVMGLGYGGFIAGPFLIGALAESNGLIAGLALVAASSLIIALTALGVSSQRKG